MARTPPQTIHPPLAQPAPFGAAQRWTRARRSLGPVVLASGLLLAVLALSIAQGAANVPPATAIGIALNRLPFVAIPVHASPTWERIVLEVRLPRVLSAAAVGGALAYAGSAYQGVFRNPLADPYLLGVASGAALGAALAIVLPLEHSAYGFGWVPVLAFAGAFIAVALAYLFSRASRGSTHASLILAGVAVSAVAGAGTSFIMLTGGPQRTMPVFAFLFGSFNTSTWTRLLVGLPYLAIGAAVIALHARTLNVLQLDEEQAAQLGVHVTRTRLVVLAAASLLAATAVAMAGIVGFVGLIVPHVVRMMFGGDYRRQLPLVALIGAAFLVAADVIARTVLAPQEVPVGIVTACIGGPFFLFVLTRRGTEGTL